MAALYLHHALFAPDSPPPPSTVQGPHDRQTSSFSTVTLRTTSEYSHPTEPLLQHEGELAGSTAYLDILARQPTHPSEPRTSWHTGLSLHADPITPRERKRIREQIVRRQLRRLRWSKRIFMTLIGVCSKLHARHGLMSSCISVVGCLQCDPLFCSVIIIPSSRTPERFTCTGNVVCAIIGTDAPFCCLVSSCYSSWPETRMVLHVFEISDHSRRPLFYTTFSSGCYKLRVRFHMETQRGPCNGRRDSVPLGY